ncbi:MAG: hypothetical protein KDD44_05605 [Bdellovibrionales bacterium]|nr:hypothetical protein [Bdellovibrionales bacterium]
MTMNDKAIIYLFAALQGLERCVSRCEEMLGSQQHQPEFVGRAIEEQKRILLTMRRTANRLQLELVKEDWNEVVRLTQTFYGLNTMVRPEILSTFQALSNKRIALQLSDNEATFH